MQQVSWKAMDDAIKAEIDEALSVMDGFFKGDDMAKRIWVHQVSFIAGRVVRRLGALRRADKLQADLDIARGNKADREFNLPGMRAMRQAR